MVLLYLAPEPKVSISNDADIRDYNQSNKRKMYQRNDMITFLIRQKAFIQEHPKARKIESGRSLKKPKS